MSHFGNIYLSQSCFIWRKIVTAMCKKTEENMMERYESWKPTKKQRRSQTEKKNYITKLFPSVAAKNKNRSKARTIFVRKHFVRYLISPKQLRVICFWLSAMLDIFSNVLLPNKRPQRLTVSSEKKKKKWLTQTFSDAIWLEW